MDAFGAWALQPPASSQLPPVSGHTAQRMTRSPARSTGCGWKPRKAAPIACASLSPQRPRLAASASAGFTDGSCGSAAGLIAPSSTRRWQRASVCDPWREGPSIASLNCCQENTIGRLESARSKEAGARISAACSPRHSRPSSPLNRLRRSVARPPGQVDHWIPHPRSMLKTPTAPEEALPN